MEMKVSFTAFLVLGMMLLSISSFQFEVLAQGGDQIKVSEKLAVDNVGDGYDDISTTLPTNIYVQVATSYKANPYILVRELRLGYARGEIPRQSVHIEFKDAENTIKVDFTIRGLALNMKDHWEIELIEGVTLVTISGNQAVFSWAEKGLGQIATILYTSTIVMPEGATSISFDEENNLLKYALPQEPVKPPEEEGAKEDWKMPAGISIAAGAIICLGLAVFLLKTEKKPPYIPAQPPVEMKYCIECGAKIEASVEFCPKCGAKQR